MFLIANVVSGLRGRLRREEVGQHEHGAEDLVPGAQRSQISSRGEYIFCDDFFFYIPDKLFLMVIKMTLILNFNWSIYSKHLICV